MTRDQLKARIREGGGDWDTYRAAFERPTNGSMRPKYREALNRMIEVYLPDIYQRIQSGSKVSKRMRSLRNSWRLRDAVFRANHNGKSEHEYWGEQNPKKRCHNCDHICSRYGKTACDLGDGGGGAYTPTHGDSWCSSWSPLSQMDRKGGGE